MRDGKAGHSGILEFDLTLLTYTVPRHQLDMWSKALGIAILLASAARVTAAPQTGREGAVEKRWFPIAPKVMIVSRVLLLQHALGPLMGHRMFSYESVWDAPFQLDQNITVPGLSPLYPEIHCDASGDVCQFVTGEGEINAASTMMVSA